MKKEEVKDLIIFLINNAGSSLSIKKHENFSYIITDAVNNNSSFLIKISKLPIYEQELNISNNIFSKFLFLIKINQK